MEVAKVQWMAIAFSVIGTSLFGADKLEVLAGAFQSKTSLKSADFQFYWKHSDGALVKCHLIFEGKRVFSKNSNATSVAGNFTIAEGYEVFDGSTLIKSTLNPKDGVQNREFSSFSRREFLSPTKDAFNWLVQSLMLENDDRLSEWGPWAQFAAKVDSVDVQEGGIVRLRASRLPSPVDYLDVYFDGTKGYFPIRFEGFLNGRCFINSRCTVEMISCADGSTLPFPVKLECHTTIGEESSNFVGFEVDPKTVRLNFKVKDEQFTSESLPRREVQAVNVDILNKNIAASETPPSKNKLPILLLGLILVLLGIVLIRQQRSIKD